MKGMTRTKGIKAVKGMKGLKRMNAVNGMSGMKDGRKEGMNDTWILLSIG